MSAVPQLNIALVGIGGYGHEYLDCLLNDERAAGTRMVGVVEPFPHRCRLIDEVRLRRIPVHPTIEALFASAVAVDLLMVATPIHLHASQTCFGLRHGASVLCEKPLAATLEDALRMAECEREARGGRFAAIGYQWSFSDAVQSLKRDVLAGVFGRPLRMKSIVFFPRGLSYFSRNDWVGRLRTARGESVFDSPANNATAHYLHNMLYLLGESRETSSTPLTVQAELYRANAIENYDTAAIRATLPSGCEVLFYTTHAVADRLGPRCRFEFENAVVEYDFIDRPRFVARFRNGRVRDYGDPNQDRTQKIWQSIEAARGGRRVACGIAAATPHVVAVVAAQKSAATIGSFPQQLRQTRAVAGEPIVCVNGLAEALVESHRRNVLPAELGSLEWATPGTPVDCRELLEAGPVPPPRVTVKIPTAASRGICAT